jgi:hypothetical protein
MSKAFSDKISQIFAHYPRIDCGSAISEGPVSEFLLSPIPKAWIHIFQIQKRLELRYSRWDAKLIFSIYDPSLKEVFDFLNQNFPEKHYASYLLDHFKNERNEDADASFGEEFMDLICKACCHSVSKYHFTNAIELVTEDDAEVFGADAIEMVDELALLANHLNSTVSQKITLLHNNIFGEEMVEIAKNKVEETYNEFKFRFREKF